MNEAFVLYNYCFIESVISQSPNGGEIEFVEIQGIIEIQYIKSLCAILMVVVRILQRTKFLSSLDAAPGSHNPQLQMEEMLLLESEVPNVISYWLLFSCSTVFQTLLHVYAIGDAVQFSSSLNSNWKCTLDKSYDA